jgi:YHS domain-containing protein
MGLFDRLSGKGPKELKKETTKEKSGMAIDPVCGMTVDEKKAPARSEYQGKTYYFCAVGCKKAFDQDPEKYIKGSPESGHGQHHM